MLRHPDEYEPLTESIIGCGIKVHEYFGPGLLESVYQRCMMIELERAALQVNSGRRVPLVYREVPLDCVFVPDLVVNDVAIVEVKALDRLARVHQTQLITYLKVTGCPVGVLMNFNVSYLRDGIRRVVHPDLYRKKV